MAACQWPMPRPGGHRSFCAEPASSGATLCAYHQSLAPKETTAVPDTAPTRPARFLAQQFNPARCQHCGALAKLHYDERCPDRYRPPTLTEAYRTLTAALASQDTARIFVARGDVQRLGGDPDLLDDRGSRL